MNETNETTMIDMNQPIAYYPPIPMREDMGEREESLTGLYNRTAALLDECAQALDSPGVWTDDEMYGLRVQVEQRLVPFLHTVEKMMNK